MVGCPILAFKPSLLGWSQKHGSSLSGKRVFPFTTSGADPAKEPVRGWVEKTLPDEVRQSVRVFPLIGRLDFTKLNRGRKVMLRIGAFVLRGDAPVDRAFLGHVGHAPRNSHDT